MYSALIALAAAFAIAVVFGPFLIHGLRILKFGQTIREDGPKRHLVKSGTPTMGGIIFLLPFVAVSLFMAGKSQSVTLFVATVLLFGLIGFVDDGIIIMLHRSLGLTAKQKLVLQFIFAFGFIYLAEHFLGRGTELIFPITGWKWDLGAFYYPLIAVYMVFIVNAVNLTDGLDGLAGGITFLVLLGYLLICLTAVFVAPVAGIDYQSLGLAAAALAGGLLGFLVYNKYPAKVFMGDTGSLALGAAVFALAVMTKTEVVFVLLGLIYIIEALSVVIQVTSFKMFGRRVFKMSPLHHHFEMCGWSEVRIVRTFWAAAALSVLLGLVLLAVS
jgi:phospho-N-acetylmuramoyl-pentapeptide-transferase